MHGTTFVAHVRYASTGAHTVANTHPFELDGRLFAHNGVVRGLDAMDARLAELGAESLVAGETDSERVFALITAEVRRHCGDVVDGVEAAVGWIAGERPGALAELRARHGDRPVGAAIPGGAPAVVPGTRRATAWR